MNTYKANAQNAALYSINAQLRQMFSPLSKPLQPKRFLYDMAVHSTDSSFYVTNCADTNDTDL